MQRCCNAQRYDATTMRNVAMLLQCTTLWCCNDGGVVVCIGVTLQLMSRQPNCFVAMVGGATLLCSDGGCRRQNFYLFLLDSFKTVLEDHLLLFQHEREEKKNEKKKKKGGGGLILTLLVSRNIMQAPSNNTGSNTNSNLRSLRQQQH